MKIEVVFDTPEPEALGTAIIRALRFTNSESPLDAEIQCNTRLASGWLEYLIVLRRPDLSHYMTIGMIQREPGAEYEFHS